jgi:4-hydroxymandelate oxidase
MRTDLTTKTDAGGFPAEYVRARTRREALRRLALFAAGSQAPVWSQNAQQRPGAIYPPTYSEDVMTPVNVHEIEAVARKKLHPLVYDYIAGGSAGEQTLECNSQAFRHLQLRRRVGNDVRRIDTSLELLGKKLPFPILLGPGGSGAKNLVLQDGDQITAKAAGHSKAVYLTGPANWMKPLQASSEAPIWWASSLGFRTKAIAESFCKRAEDAGASAISITVDYPYGAPRDRNIRNKFDEAWLQTGIPANRSGKPLAPFLAGMIQPYTPNATWEQMGWVHSATKLPLVIKGIVTEEDARLAVERGAQVIVVSNHGGRTLDGMIPTLYALPEVLDAVKGRIPVLVDGGVRRGADIIKALALGAKAILIGRPYYFGLAAFGQVGVQRVIELLHAEMRLAMGMAGVPNLAAFNDSMVEWIPGNLPVTTSAL